MKVIIIGYGSMGHEIERVLAQKNHSIVARIDPVAPDADSAELNHNLLEQADTAIEFSLASGVLANAKFYAEHGIKAVIGTTGWESDLPEVSSLFAQRRSGSGARSGSRSAACIHGSNFSIGANIFFNLVEKAASAISGLPEYDIMTYEVHHQNKKDSPSGTALTTADRILKAHQGKTSIVTEKLDRRPEQNELHVASVRGGTIPGIHTVLIDSTADTIELRHSARNRTGFAHGAVLAAEWLQKKSGVYTIDNFITSIIGEGENA
ncbi:MAG: 4-hydroxy-tetrahydrodipicolinate reductase [Spirochaetales bacterium]|jgi:4-hydroxy-tetrahydrodipicolinate reductase|nr:4-hydroxy-tetrahydrodipicolinate reductase [Spirochaetales bacterium]